MLPSLWSQLILAGDMDLVCVNNQAYKPHVCVHHPKSGDYESPTRRFAGQMLDVPLYILQEKNRRATRVCMMKGLDE